MMHFSIFIICLLFLLYNNSIFVILFLFIFCKGFKESKIACCGSGLYRGINSCGGKRSVVKEYELCKNASEYVFFDPGHPSEMVNQQFAKLMWSGTPNVIGPYNLKTLFEL